MNLHSPAYLAEKLEVSPRKVLKWRIEFGWPSVKIGRQIYFTDEDLAEILERHHNAGTKKDKKATAPAAAGQPTLVGPTKKSAARQRARS